MKNKLNYILFTTTFVAIFTFRMNAQETIRFKEKDFQKAVKVKSEKVNNETLLNPLSLLVVDSLIIVTNDNVPVFFDILSLNSGDKITSFGNRGRGPGEILTPFSIYYDESLKELVVYDLTTKNLLYYSLPAILKGNKEYFTKQITIKGCYPVRVYNANNEMIAAIMGSEEGNCFAELEPDGKVKSYFGLYPEIGIPYNKNIAHSLFSTFSGMNSNYIVNGFNYWDRIEIYNNKKLSLIIEGPDYNKFDVVSGNGDAVKTSNNNIAYTQSCLCDSFFIISYTGKNYYKNNGSEHLFKIGYDGTLLTDYKLDVPIISMSIYVDWKKGYVYAIVTDPDPRIVRFKL